MPSPHLSPPLTVQKECHGLWPHGFLCSCSLFFCCDYKCCSRNADSDVLRPDRHDMVRSQTLCTWTPLGCWGSLLVHGMHCMSRSFGVVIVVLKWRVVHPKCLLIEIRADYLQHPFHIHLCMDLAIVEELSIQHLRDNHRLKESVVYSPGEPTWIITHGFLLSLSSFIIINNTEVHPIYLPVCLT